MTLEAETTDCPIIEGLMQARLVADDSEHPAIDVAIDEIWRLRKALRVAGQWDEYHPAYIAGARAPGTDTPIWLPPSEHAGGQCIAADENGEECCAFYNHTTGKWYLHSNNVDPELEFQPRAWARLPAYRA